MSCDKRDGIVTRRSNKIKMFTKIEAQKRAAKLVSTYNKLK